MRKTALKVEDEDLTSDHSLINNAMLVGGDRIYCRIMTSLDVKLKGHRTLRPYIHDITIKLTILTITVCREWFDVSRNSKEDIK